MAIIDVVIIPLDKTSVSISKYIAEIQNLLKLNKEKGIIDYHLTPMSTLIEGELSDCLKVLEEIHELPFQHGIDRVCTNVRIDDRRDKKRSMFEKIKSVEKHM